MSTATKQHTLPIKGTSSDDREAWLEERSHGATATEVAKVINNRAADVRQIVIDKITGNWVDLTGNKFIDWGNEREPIIAGWVESKFGIVSNLHCYRSGDNPNYLATPDGFVDDAFMNERSVSEIKTSKNDLFPLDTARPESGHATLSVDVANDLLENSRSKFWASGYYDQMQWQMFVMGADRCLFVFEQHKDDWVDNKPTPLPLVAVWVERNNRRITKLIVAADSLIKRVEQARVEGLAPVSEIDSETADLIHGYLQGLADEKIGAALKKKNWDKLQARFGKVDDDAEAENDEAKITWRHSVTSNTELDADLLASGSAAQQARVTKSQQAVDRANERVVKAETALKRVRAGYDDAAERMFAVQTRFSTTTEIVGKGKLTVTAKKTK